MHREAELGSGDLLKGKPLRRPSVRGTGLQSPLPLEDVKAMFPSFVIYTKPRERRDT